MNNFIYAPLTKTSKSLLNIGCINLRSVRNKSAAFLNSIIDGCYDIVVYTESWLNMHDDVIRTLITPQGFELIDSPRENRVGRGIGIIFKSGFKMKLISKGIKLSYEYLEVNFIAQGYNIILLIVYRPPYSQANSVTTNVFFDKFESHLDSLIVKSGKLMLIGDFNIHMDNPTNNDCKKFNDILNTYGLINNIDFCTQESGHTLDLVITRKIDEMKLIHTEPGPFLSDHRFVRTIFNIKKPTTEKRKIKFRKLSNIDQVTFQHDIRNSILYTDEFVNINCTQMAETFDQTLTDIMNRHAPEVDIIIKLKPLSPWYNGELTQIKLEKRNLERNWLKNKTPLSELAFKNKTKEYISKCEKFKDDYFKTNISDCNGDQRKIYSLLEK